MKKESNNNLEDNISINEIGILVKLGISILLIGTAL